MRSACKPIPRQPILGGSTMSENYEVETNGTATVSSERMHPRARAALEFLAKRRFSSQLARYEGRKIPWLWQGYLARGKISLLTSQWKAGKTTLISILLARMAEGGSLAGLEVAPCRAAIITEEDEKDWDLRKVQLGIGEQVNFFCRPFRTKPTMDEWLGIIDALV